MIPDSQNPDYFLDTFPRDDFPRCVWTDRPQTLPTSAWTTETTHRDGQQGGLPLTVEQSLAIYDILCDFTGHIRRDPSGGVLRLSSIRRSRARTLSRRRTD